MTERAFDLPKVIPSQPAPPQSRQQDIDAGLSQYVPQKTKVTQEIDHASATKADEIKAWLRLLTHREMRELVKEIYVAHSILFKTEMSSVERAIKVAELPDVLDKIAHGD
jgi:hypothetical protein